MESSSPPDSLPRVHRRTYWTVLFRALRLRCPLCGVGKAFSGWIRMRPTCDHCGYKFDREPGYFLGSIYFNYGLTALLVTAGFFIGFFVFTLSPDHMLWGLTAFCVLFPIWFFRYARSLWMGFDTFWDPVERQSGNVQQDAPKDPASP